MKFNSNCDFYHEINPDIEFELIEQPADLTALDNYIYVNVEFINFSMLKFLINKYHNSHLSVTLSNSSGVLLFQRHNSIAPITINLEVDIAPYSFLVEFEEKYTGIRSRRQNNVYVDNETIVKQSTLMTKINAEYLFIKKMNKAGNSYYPAVRDYRENDNIAEYKIAKISPGDISGQFIEKNKDFFKFIKFFDKIEKYFLDVSGSSTLKNYKCEFQNTLNLRYQSTVDSLGTNSHLDMIILSLLNIQTKRLQECFEAGWFDFLQNVKCGPIHGDLCLSNILYSAEKEDIKLIDPKGTTQFPIVYDLAKLSHSISGRYDEILADYFDITIKDEVFIDFVSGDQSFLLAEFQTLVSNLGYDINHVKLIESFLFTTMLPFHTDNKKRCIAFLITAKNILDEIIV